MILSSTLAAHVLLASAPLGALASSGASSATQSLADEVRDTYRACHASADDARLRATWVAHPELALVTIDADLEGGLAAWEAAEEGHEERTRTLFARALWGARLASEASGHPIFADYASAFVAWDDDERASFRRGQALHGEAREAARTGDHATALAAGRECHERAERLGDWWGTAMGLAAEGRALLALERPAEAAVALGRARLVYHDLVLLSSEYASVRGLAEALEAAGSPQRAHAAVTDAIALARRLERDPDLEALLAARARLERALGLAPTEEDTTRRGAR